jgi:hypothetical protein
VRQISKFAQYVVSGIKAGGVSEKERKVSEAAKNKKEHKRVQKERSFGIWCTIDNLYRHEIGEPSASSFTVASMDDVRRIIDLTVSKDLLDI